VQHAVMEVVQLWRFDLMLKHMDLVGAAKSGALIEVVQLWKVQLWRCDCTVLLCTDHH
jgi:hypothetical protein